MKMATIEKSPSWGASPTKQLGLRAQLLAMVHESGSMSVEELVKELGSFRWAVILRVISELCEEGLLKVENKGYSLQVHKSFQDHC